MQKDTLVLDIHNLDVEYDLPERSIHAVRSLELRVRSGEVLAVVGESGSGKSTLGLALLGLVRKPGKIKSGSILFKGNDVLKLGEKEIRKIRGKQIAAVPQDPMTSLNPVRTISDHFKEYAEAHESKLSSIEIETRTKTVFDYVNLPQSALSSYPHELSGGMRQRVMISLALFFGPDLILADEPTTALDVVTEGQILEIFARLQRDSGLSIILFTHNFGIVSKLANRVAVMYAGNIVEEGETLEMLQYPAHPYTRALVDSIPKLSNSKRELVFIPGSPPDPSNLPGGCTFHPRCKYATQICTTVVPEITKESKRDYACHNPLPHEVNRSG